MRRESDPTVLLQRLLERHERSKGGRSIIERPAQSFETPSDLRRLVESLTAAAETGAVTIFFDRDAPHLIERVILANAESLYAFTGRTPRDQQIDAASETLLALPLQSEPAEAFRVDILGAWSGGRSLQGMNSTHPETACRLVRAMDAIFTELEDDVPIRTRSARILGDSKALEAALPTLIAYLKRAGVLDVALSREEAAARLGLSKYAQPVFVAGPLRIGGMDVGVWPFAGVPPELVSDVHPTVPIRSVLTVENLESFNRHVRSCREPGDVVVYTGGFPGRSVLALLRKLIAHSNRHLYHWGDIDPGGVRIGCHMEAALDVRITPHLMGYELAHSLGRPPVRGRQPLKASPGSAFAPLAQALNQPDALWLEQEVIDPMPISLG